MPAPGPSRTSQAGHAVKTEVPPTPDVSRCDTPGPVGPCVSAGPPHRTQNPNPRPLRAARADGRGGAHRPVRPSRTRTRTGSTRDSCRPRGPTTPKGYFRELPRRSGDPRGQPPVAARADLSRGLGGQYGKSAPPSLLYPPSPPPNSNPLHAIGVVGQHWHHS
jgi:hypothetical protein